MRRCGMKIFKTLYGFAVALIFTLSVNIPAFASSGDFASSTGGRIAISIGIGLLLGLIPMLVMYGKMKTVRRNNRASSYVKENSLNITHQNDIYLYKNVVRTPIPKADKK